MRYIDGVMNGIKREYFKILGNNLYPEFIDKYIATSNLQRLAGVGQFCGCDYTNLHQLKFWYSRLDHSAACALMAWKLTKSPEQTLAALFHDLGTPTFSHCVDFYLNDHQNQESSEIPIIDVITGSEEIKNLLKKDKVDINDVAYADRYSILENKKPQLCIDRLEGILGTELIWQGVWNNDIIERLYKHVVILVNEEDLPEIGFDDVRSAEMFYEGVYDYSVVLQTNEDILTMQFIADCLKFLIDNKIISFEDLWRYSEADIINFIRNNDYLRERWQVFATSRKLIRSDVFNDSIYTVENKDIKKRTVIPLCVANNGQVVRANTVSEKIKYLEHKYLNYQDSRYASLSLVKK